MLAYAGEDREELRELLNCLIETVRNDPLNGFVHGNGWGLVAYTDNGLLLHYRSGKPIFGEGNVANKLVDMLSGKMWVIIHARRASDPLLVGAIFSHPYLESTPNELIYIAHNGTVDKGRLGEELGVDVNHMVDSELIGKFIVRHGLSQETLKKLEQYVRHGSALNLLILRIPRNRSEPPRIYYYNHINHGEDEEHKNDNTEYYKLYYRRYNNGIAVFSSSLASPKLNKPCKADGKVKQGELTDLEELIKLIKLKAFHYTM